MHHHAQEHCRMHCCPTLRTAFTCALVRSLHRIAALGCAHALLQQPAMLTAPANEQRDASFILARLPHSVCCRHMLASKALQA